jgi:PAS domain S-box-containing protein
LLERYAGTLQHLRELRKLTRRLGNVVMNHRGAFAVLIVSSAVGVSCTIWLTLKALSPPYSWAAFGTYTLLCTVLAWSVVKLLRGMQDSARRFRALFESSNDAVVILDGETIVECNPATLNLLRRQRSEVVGHSALDFSADRQIDGHESRALFEELYAALRRGQHVVREWTLLRADGTDIPTEISLSQVEYGRRALGQVVVRDISERKEAERVRTELEDNLRWAQKMEAVGTLAGGVAHDFNNLMHVVTGYSDLLLLNSKNHGITQELHEIKEAAARASALTRQLLLFSRRAEHEMANTDLNGELSQVVEILRRTIPKMVAIETRLADDLRHVDADTVQLEQVLVNLALNASDAMPGGGTLTLETRNVVLDEQCSETLLDLEPGEYVMIEVTDTGHGMPRETVSRIFEPFFTTKALGKGTGLGLAMVYGIVRAHHGRVTCHSEPGVGTTFRIYLPAATTPELGVRESAPEAPLPRGSETVLLVDDEESVREVGRQLLSTHGYRVLEADTGEAALELVERSRDSVDLVILDYIMPGMGGRRCLQQLRKIAPRLPVIISSGYSAEATSDDLLMMGARAFVGKPYQVRTLLELVRRVLNETGSANGATAANRAVLH